MTELELWVLYRVEESVFSLATRPRKKIKMKWS
jgi:hypothetical protein